MLFQTVTCFKMFPAQGAGEGQVVDVLGLNVPEDILLLHGSLPAVRAGPGGPPLQLEHLRQDQIVQS